MVFILILGLNLFLSMYGMRRGGFRATDNTIRSELAKYAGRLAEIRSWDVSQVTNMAGLFEGMDLTGVDLSAWIVSNVTDMSDLFNGSHFEGDLSEWNTKKVTNMMGMFQGCTRFNSDLSRWNVSNVTEMGFMFQGCSLFNQDLSAWEVSNVDSMASMFLQCSALTGRLDWGDKTSRVTNMNSMFQECVSLDTEDIGHWDVSNVEDMGSMFQGCVRFDRYLDEWDVSTVTDMSHLFSGCVAYNKPLSWHVNHVTDMSHMFQGCTLFNQPLDRWDVRNVVDMSYMFQGCTRFNQRLNGWKVYSVTEHTGMFDQCPLAVNRQPRFDQEASESESESDGEYEFEADPIHRNGSVNTILNEFAHAHAMQASLITPFVIQDGATHYQLKVQFFPGRNYPDHVHATLQGVHILEIREIQKEGRVMPPEEVRTMAKSLIEHTIIDAVIDRQTDELEEGWIRADHALILTRAALAKLKAEKEERTRQFQLVSARKGLLPSHLAKHIGDKYGGHKRTRKKYRYRV